MRHDRPATGACVIQETDEGIAYEMDVWLYRDELKPAPGYALEPWVRITCGVDVTLAAGIVVSRHEEDGA